MYFIFDICIMWFLRSSKTWLSERFEADMNCFYLNTFHSILTFLYFYMITNFDSCYHHCYFHFIFIIISSFSMPLTFFYSSFIIPKSSSAAGRTRHVWTCACVTRWTSIVRPAVDDDLVVCRNAWTCACVIKSTHGYVLV